MLLLRDVLTNDHEASWHEEIAKLLVHIPTT